MTVFSGLLILFPDLLLGTLAGFMGHSLGKYSRLL